MSISSILSWNVAGIRACIKKGGLDFLLIEDYDIVCFQETKAEEHQVKLPFEMKEKYPYRYWHATQGITQRKGLSGTSIWCKTEPIKVFEPMEMDVEGRTIALEFSEFIIVTVYTPNSQKLNSDRFYFRTEEWDIKFREYVDNLNKIKPVIMCGDFNVAHSDIDIHNPDQNRNKSAGFLNAEKDNFSKLLETGYIDTFRKFCVDPGQYTYWDQRNPKLRENNKGWRIDYFLVFESFIDNIKDSKIRPDIYGSDHCPVILSL